MIRNSFAFSIPQCHTYSRIRNTAGTINFRIVLLPHFITTHKTYFLYIFPFIAWNRKSIIYPQKRTNLHSFVRLAHLFHSVGTQANNFARSYIFLYFIIQIRQTAWFTCRSIRTLFFTYHNRSTPPFVTCCYNTVFRQYQHGAWSFDFIKDILYTIYKIFPLHNKQCDQLRLIRLAKTHFRKVHISCQQVAFQFRNVIDFSYCDDGELA